MRKRRTFAELRRSVTLSCSAHSVGSLALAISMAISSASAAPPSATTNDAAPAIAETPASTARSRQCINVPGVCRRRQVGQERRDLVSCAPAVEDERLALADRGIEPSKAEHSATLDAALGYVALDRRELERERRDRAREPAERFRLV